MVVQFIQILRTSNYSSNLLMTRPYLILKRYNKNNGGSNYKLENVTSKHCPKCNQLLFNEVNQPEIDYPYVCLLCNENFYNFELNDFARNI